MWVMIYEQAAGGVIVSWSKGMTQVLLIKDKKGRWTYPKGVKKLTETKVETARRGVSEEVGIKRLKLLQQLTPVKYKYKWEGRLITKTVYYYLFQNHGQKSIKPQIEEGIMDVQWFPLKAAFKFIGYPRTNQSLLIETQKYIHSQFTTYHSI